MSEDRLQKAFRYVCKTFFPQWNTKGDEWRIIDATAEKEAYDMSIDAEREYLGISQIMGEADIQANCCEEDKCIKIFKIPEDDAHLQELIIHEICHINATGHGAKWARNMQKAFCTTCSHPNVSKELQVLIHEDRSENMDMFDDLL